MDVDTGLIQRLMEIGYLAAGNGQAVDAQKIFSGLVAVRPESELPLIGLAVAQFSAGNAADAVKTLSEQALRINPDSDLAKSFLGLALHQTGFQNESRSILQDVIDANADESAVSMARNLLDENG